MNDKLKPCPFCGNEPTQIEARDWSDEFVHHYEIGCFECGFQIGDEYRSEVVKNWNRRTRTRPSPTS